MSKRKYTYRLDFTLKNLSRIAHSLRERMRVIDKHIESEAKLGAVGEMDNYWLREKGEYGKIILLIEEVVKKGGESEQ